MKNYNTEFINSILPGNYWLTKSMEFGKINSSGTLWYLKKWIILYYFIFFKKELNLNDYQEIVQKINSYIDSIGDQNAKEKANEFFFTPNLKKIGTEVLTLDKFLNISSQSFINDEERKQYILTGKKFYFIYLMNIGGQSGYKKYIKNLINEKNTFNEILKKLKTKINNDSNISNNNKVKKYREYVNDFHAALRNERQIFFYYGFIHGKEDSDIKGFHKLTNVGKMILECNYYELLLLWEHQKLKMISQTPVTKWNNLKKSKLNCKNFLKFDINLHPYYSLLEYLYHNEELNKEEYKYFLSRINEKNKKFTPKIINKEEIINKIKEKIKTFNRKSDYKNEDFEKELKKFLLGIINYPFDFNSNPLKLLEYNKSKKTYEIIDKKKFEELLKFYKKITLYMDERYKKQYIKFRRATKINYLLTLEIIKKKNEDFLFEAVYEWNKYIINYDKIILLSLVYVLTKFKLKQFSLNSQFKKEIIKIFPTFYKYFFANKTDFFIELEKFRDLLEDSNIESLKENYQLFEKKDYNINYSKEEIAFIDKINEEILRKESLKIIKSFKTQRSTKIINLLKKFYFTNFKEKNNLIKCDCCGKYTFITENNLPYLEFHHIIPFAENGPDYYLNLVGLCPNCHRKFHFLKKDERIKLYKELSENNNFKIKLEERIKKMMDDDALQPINLEFLRKEKIISIDMYNELLNRDIAV